ncbi:MAG: hypothetical protein GWP10_07875, partial [Nitrospiraceae bacterium]|nr:hypothetical protein [Nitrospiraceae bacterium]
KWSAKSNFLDLYRDRWEKLGNYHCNPWPELELLTSVVEKTPPAPALTERIEKGFDPGRLTIAHHFYSGLHIISDIRPAFAFLRILEEGALPPTCGMVSMFPDAIVSAAKWIAPFAPLWALSSLIRSGEIKGPEWLFSRARVAVLSQNNVDHFYALFTNSLTQGMQYLNGITPRDTMLKARFSRQQLEISAESLSRICFRFSPAQIDKLFKLAVDMYNLPFFYKYDLSPRDSLKTLFKRLLYVMPQAEILKRIFKLLSLPIPTEMGFEVGVPQTWIEPFNYIKWLENTKLSPNFDRSAWDAPIENLLRIVKNGTAEARKRASLRLAKLYEINALSDKETKTFSQALWSRVDSKKHLPSDTYFYDYSFLRLPENKKGEAKENFRKYLLSVNFPRVLEHSTTPGGKWKTTHLSVGSQDNRYIKELLASTAPLFPKDEKEKQKYVDWTLNEVVQMLEKAVAWWDEEKVDLNTNLFVRDLKKRFSFLVQLMSKVILPRLSSARKEVKDLAMKLLTEMGKSDICILSALPMTLFINPDSYDEVVQKMQNGLNSKKQEEIRDSLSGFLRWSFYSNKKKICAPPPILLDKIIDRVASRRQPGLNSVIELISTIVRRFPELLNEKQIKSLLTALDKLIEETKIPKFQDQWEMDNVPMIIPIDNRPEYRKLAAELAYYLFNQLQKEGGKISPVLRKWKEICRNDSLPEVKKVWQ